MNWVRTNHPFSTLFQKTGKICKLWITINIFCLFVRFLRHGHCIFILMLTLKEELKTLKKCKFPDSVYLIGWLYIRLLSHWNFVYFHLIQILDFRLCLNYVMEFRILKPWTFVYARSRHWNFIYSYFRMCLIWSPYYGIF